MKWNPEMVNYCSPAYRCKKTWRCSICGAIPSCLAYQDRKIPEKLRCSHCLFPYSLRWDEDNLKRRFTPRPALNPEWRAVWKRAWSAWGAGDKIVAFCADFDSPLSAANKLNALVGGRLIFDEQMAMPTAVKDQADKEVEK